MKYRFYIDIEAPNPLTAKQSLQEIHKDLLVNDFKVQQLSAIAGPGETPSIPQPSPPYNPRPMAQGVECISIQDPDTIRGFKDGFDSEHYLVLAIKSYLMDNLEWKFLHDNNLSIEDCLNGRYSGDMEKQVFSKLYAVWNARLGYRSFGH